MKYIKGMLGISVVLLSIACSSKFEYPYSINKGNQSGTSGNNNSAISIAYNDTKVQYEGRIISIGKQIVENKGSKST